MISYSPTSQAVTKARSRIASALFVLLLCLALLPNRAGGRQPLIQAKQATAKRPPNVILILGDDLGWNGLGSYGNKFIETPNLDRLAAQGLRFTQAYAAAPVCAPTRASIMTGQHPARVGMYNVTSPHRRPFAKLLPPPLVEDLPLRYSTPAEALAPAGYVSACIGKWHLGGKGFEPRDQGFAPAPAANLSGVKLGVAAEFERFARDNPHKNAGAYTLQAARFLTEQRAQPFFLYLNYLQPHEHMEARPALVRKYEEKAQRQSSEHARRIHPGYAAMVETLDEAVGLVLRTLDELRLAEETVVIFTSDNGAATDSTEIKSPTYYDNAPLRSQKGTLYEGGIRVPLIVRWLGVVAAGAVNHSPVSSVDLYPTLLDLASVKPPDGQVMDGRSLLPLLRGAATQSPGALYWHFPAYHQGPPASAIRDGDDKLIEFLEDGRVELYDLARDPGERHNLAKTAPRQAATLHAKLRDWRAAVKAGMPERNPGYDPLRDYVWGVRAYGTR